MSRLVIADTCAIAAAFFNEPCSSNADTLLAAIKMRTVEAIAPAVCLSEFMNVCRKKHEGAKGAPPLAKSAVNAVLDDFLNLPITWVPIDAFYTREAWSLYSTHQIETNDAYFLAIAQLWAGELWTTDLKFHSKASPIYHHVFELNSRPFS